MADRPVRPRHRPGAKRIDPEPVEKPKPPQAASAPESAAPAEPAGRAGTGGEAEAGGKATMTDVTETTEVRVPQQARPRRTPDPSRTWRLRPRGLVAHEVRERWTQAQGEFVDDPPRSVREADALADEVADALIAEIEARRASLRSVWNDSEADTEALRLVLRDYRSFVKQMVGDD
ncbi:hypothetical protein [Nocardiopsis metallicus]|uniref:Uncharacterized protein n=1 Tax=Nocardiopsis metallicus TaxID=179819 RepID=A0A840WBK4_9ACTN|nr:hypothetical protein [Nocardiopsis metallicus]MBB5489137.1 hypothetical protein [Nocardiopsis metallicus]